MRLSSVRERSQPTRKRFPRDHERQKPQYAEESRSQAVLNLDSGKNLDYFPSDCPLPHVNSE